MVSTLRTPAKPDGVTVPVVAVHRGRAETRAADLDVAGKPGILGTSTTSEGPVHGETRLSMTHVTTYSCDTCRTRVTSDEAFIRSVNLRTVAWCRACWLSRHSELSIPLQREASSAPGRRAPRRRLLGRR
jgi:hypothetical protein